MSDDSLREKQDKAALLSIFGALAMIVAYSMSFSVLTDTDMASKLENGVVPAGTDITGTQMRVIGSVIASILSVVLATAGNIVHSNAFTKLVAVLAYLAVALFTMITLVTVGLAF
ncbi:hypothetical protein BKG76_00280 [Mycobacteroides franklinii]|uniref:Uncharacterized protein n=1 Tax=Mycobacteroides franklinii TaxID=948102 RepID=A0A1S1LF38_9MYCO|nr:hypothetical protein [Mycobacteroides franklinii]OHU31689.1 hypothetical protein BKG76_00280 [Mycobacteroides franklinii]